MKQDIYWGTIKQKKPKCYKYMDEMSALVEKCKTCLYQVDCLILTAKKKGWLKHEF